MICTYVATKNTDDIIIYVAIIMRFSDIDESPEPIVLFLIYHNSFPEFPIIINHYLFITISYIPLPITDKSSLAPACIKSYIIFIVF